MATSTGCRTPTGVEVRRSGDDLRVGFTGGALCDAPRWFLATFEVPADLVADGAVT